MRRVPAPQTFPYDTNQTWRFFGNRRFLPTQKFGSPNGVGSGSRRGASRRCDPPAGPRIGRAGDFAGINPKKIDKPQNMRGSKKIGNENV